MRSGSVFVSRGETFGVGGGGWRNELLASDPRKRIYGRYDRLDSRIVHHLAFNSVSSLMKLLRSFVYASSLTTFSLLVSFYNQVDDVAMGVVPPPLHAVSVIWYHEKCFLKH